MRRLNKITAEKKQNGILDEDFQKPWQERDIARLRRERAPNARGFESKKENTPCFFGLCAKGAKVAQFGRPCAKLKKPAIFKFRKFETLLRKKMATKSSKDRLPSLGRESKWMAPPAENGPCKLDSKQLEDSNRYSRPEKIQKFSWNSSSKKWVKADAMVQIAVGPFDRGYTRMVFKVKELNQGNIQNHIWIFEAGLSLNSKDFLRIEKRGSLSPSSAAKL